MTLAELQRDMRGAYLWGAPGMITSGCVWLAAALAAQMGTPAQAVWVLFIGAAFIHPVSIVVVRLLGASGKHSPGNALATLAMESTICMIMSLPLAYGLSLFRAEWFFPAVLMIIGGRYLLFHTIYGAPAYWLAAGLLGWPHGPGSPCRSPRRRPPCWAPSSKSPSAPCCWRGHAGNAEDDITQPGSDPVTPNPV